MNPSDPLATLAPLRAPEQIGFWPPAPGWWILLALALCLLGLGAWLLWRGWQAAAYRRNALKALQSLPAEQNDFDAEVNRLLKAVALRSYGRPAVAALSGTAWLEFLASTGGDFPQAFSSGPYQRPGQRSDCEAIRHAAITWVKQHRRPV